MQYLVIYQMPGDGLRGGVRVFTTAYSMNQGHQGQDHCARVHPDCVAISCVNANHVDTSTIIAHG